MLKHILQICLKFPYVKLLLKFNDSPHFIGAYTLSRCFLDFSVGVGAFVIGLSQISSFFSYICICNTIFNRFRLLISFEKIRCHTG